MIESHSKADAAHLSPVQSGLAVAAHFAKAHLLQKEPNRTQLSMIKGLMKTARLAALVLAIDVASVWATSWQDDSHYVALGPRTGYYIVRPSSRLSHQLGLDAAPTIDTADPFRHGYGADALAFRFNRAGTLSAAPAYIVQAIPNQFYTSRLGSFIRGRTRLSDVHAFFGKPQSIENRSDGLIAFYAIQVYNPFEDRSSRGGGH